jgi:ferredoxin
VDLIRAAAGAVRGRGACAHPDGTSRFAVSALDTFLDDIALHLSAGGCGQPIRGILPIPAAATDGRRLSVDWTRCDGHGLCAHIIPELINLDGNGFPAVADRPLPEWLEHSARRAVSMCPALALRLST